MAENDDQEPSSVRLRIRREAGGLWGKAKSLLTGIWQSASQSGFGDWYKARWADSRRFRWFNYLLGAFIAFNLLFWVTVTRNLPSAETLLTYQPPLPTMVRGINGEIVYSYARERRVQLRYVDFPEKLKNAYLSAEDKNFWTHGGVDYIGVASAVIDNITKIGTDERGRGGSTITQQVAKNILVGNERSLGRKVREMVLARRIEAVLTKQQILELYLNEIPLGRQSFGVEAAAQAYFGKSVADLTLAEDAFLAILPKAPEKYGRSNHAAEALERRNWVLDQMVKNGAVPAAEAAAAKARPLGIIPRRGDNWDPANGYFVEEVRRQLIDKYGENADAGPNSVYAGGLWVRTSLDPQMQKASQDALRTGLVRFGGAGSGKALDHVDLDTDAWQSQIALLNKSISYLDWRVGLVLDRSDSGATIGFADGTKGPLSGAPAAIKPGDVVAAAPAGPQAWAFRSVPEITGGMMLEDAHSGRIMAIQGGFDAGLGSFNRATQAQRQPGSTIKPFVYGTGLDYGMSPSSEVLDGKFCVYQGSSLGQKCFQNFGNAGGAGATHTMRWGLEQSRNLMTVRIASDAGMDHVAQTFERVGIGKYPPYLAFALGAGETTVQQMVNAYAALANNGVQYQPTVIDYVQDRSGKVIWRADTRRCQKCNMPEWDGKPMPRFDSRGKQVMDPRTAFQVVHMLEGVVTRGTAYILGDLGLPLFGKTGTTTGPTNVWFVGGNQDIVGGVYLGYDQPRPLGGWAQGGTIAAPIFKQMVLATKPRWSTNPFVAPAEIHWVKVDRISGKRVFSGEPGEGRDASVIWEAFKAESEARPGIGTEELEKQRAALISAARKGAGKPLAPTADTSAGDAKEPDAVPTISTDPPVGNQ